MRQHAVRDFKATVRKWLNLRVARNRVVAVKRFEFLIVLNPPGLFDVVFLGRFGFSRRSLVLWLGMRDRLRTFRWFLLDWRNRDCASASQERDP